VYVGVGGWVDVTKAVEKSQSFSRMNLDIWGNMLQK
jgi:hypothetical protein